MKTLACFIKTFKENLRDWKILILVIIFAPFFVFMIYMYMGNPGSSVYNMVLVNHDDKGIFSNELISAWQKIKNDDGASILSIRKVDDSLTAKEMIKNKDADLFITIPADFSDSFIKFNMSGKGFLSSLESYGDQANMKFMAAASFIDYTTLTFVSQKTGIEIPMNVKYQYAGRGKNLNDFDLYVPALLVLSIIMMLFTAGASIVREVEKDTVTRLSLSKLKSYEFMAALGLNQTIIGFICLFLTLLAAFSVGYSTSGSILLLILIGALTCFSVISISIITACFIKTMFGLLTVGCFPFFVLMFFSDCFLPLPKINLMSFAGHQVYLNDILPTATATRAFNKILNYNSGFSDVSFEILWILALSLIYFFIGVTLFRKKYKY
jgi:ABC-2 type transport system permease protein